MAARLVRQDDSASSFALAIPGGWIMSRPSREMVASVCQMPLLCYTLVVFPQLTDGAELCLATFLRASDEK